MKESKKTAEQAILDDALIAAVKASDTAAVVSLLERGADPDISVDVDLYGHGALPTSALMLALNWYSRRETNGLGIKGSVNEEFNEPLVRALIEGGASLLKASQFDEPPLCRAVSMGCLIPDCREFVRFMLDRGADVNELHNDIFTALHAACGPTGDNEIVSILLDRGADINPQTGYDSPLMWAVRFRQKDTVALLLNCGADFHYRAGNSETALSLAKWIRGVGKEIREMLEAAGRFVSRYNESANP